MSRGTVNSSLHCTERPHLSCCPAPNSRRIPARPPVQPGPAQAGYMDVLGRKARRDVQVKRADLPEYMAWAG